MNKCLLMKWIWKIHQNPDALWFRILKAKYMNEKGFFASKESGGGGGGGVLSFGKGLHKVKHLFKWGTVFEVGDGQLCRFWEDCWALGLVRNPSCTVTDCWKDGSWGMDFKRSLSIQEYNRWLGLLETIHDKNLTDNKAVLRRVCYSDTTVTTPNHLQTMRSKVSLAAVLLQCHSCGGCFVIRLHLILLINGDVNCFLCGEVESVDHVFFTCHLATLIWSMIREVFNLERYPNSLCDFSSMWILGKGHLPSRLIIFVFAGLAWALWTTRNKMAIEKIIPKSPTDVMYVALSLLQKWSVRLKDEDQDRISHSSWRASAATGLLELTDRLGIDQWVLLY
ncbi:hypothetical protein PVAP13_9NG087473 [Panicum virgatum]|uniref:Reverse transcriptase zinc-binding domain-containing protein n=1 Tax=Panicum virgatum TaxID=38727 RepID=A0A8T0MEX2_PANVG|nr:hypothetical protein PVAP13_9NG087473 [Panicum virgatum]